MVGDALRTKLAERAAIRSCGRWPRAVRAGRDEQVVRARRHGRAKQPLLGQMQVLGLMIRARRPYTCHSTRRPPTPGAVTPRPGVAALCQQVLSAYGDAVEPRAWPRLSSITPRGRCGHSLSADGNNPEVCDPYDINCSNLTRCYFDVSDNFLGVNQNSPPGGFAFTYYTCAAVKPEGASNCPASAADCQYAPVLKDCQLIVDKSTFGSDEIAVQLPGIASYPAVRRAPEPFQHLYGSCSS